MDPEEVKHKLVRSVVALTGRSLFLQLINGAALFLLGAFLSPSAVGVYLVVSAVIRIFNLFTDVGLGAALIQKKQDLDENDIKVAFTIQEILVIGTVTVGFLLTPVVKSQANLSPDGVVLYYVLLLTLFISSLKVIPSILLERKIAFEKQIFPQIVEAIVFDIVVVFLAMRGLEVQAYSWAIILSALAGLPIYYLISPWRIGFAFSWAKAKHLFSYGLAFQGKSVLAVIKDDLLTFFLSGLVGTSGVGYWGTAQRWAYFPYRFLVDSITKVTFPAYSRVQDNTAALRSGIEKSLFLVSLILFPVLTAMIMLVRELIFLIPRYGKWEPALLSFYFLCAQAGLAALTNILVNVLDATGRVRTTLYLMVLWIITTWILTIVLVGRLGFTGIALAQFLVAFSLILVVYLTKRVVAFSFWAQVYKPFIASVVMALGIGILQGILPNSSSLSVVAEAVSGAIIYGMVILLLARRQIKENMHTILSAYKH